MELYFRVIYNIEKNSDADHQIILELIKIENIDLYYFLQRLQIQETVVSHPLSKNKLPNKKKAVLILAMWADISLNTSGYKQRHLNNDYSQNQEHIGVFNWRKINNLTNTYMETHRETEINNSTIPSNDVSESGTSGNIVNLSTRALKRISRQISELIYSDFPIDKKIPRLSRLEKKAHKNMARLEAIHPLAQEFSDCYNLKNTVRQNLENTVRIRKGSNQLQLTDNLLLTMSFSISSIERRERIKEIIASLDQYALGIFIDSEREAFKLINQHISDSFSKGDTTHEHGIDSILKELEEISVKEVGSSNIPRTINITLTQCITYLKTQLNSIRTDLKKMDETPMFQPGWAPTVKSRKKQVPSRFKSMHTHRRKY